MFLQLGSMSESRSPETTSSLPMGPPHGPMKTSQDNVELCRRHQLCLGEQTHLEALNKGSFGHPELCRKPCQFFHLGTCAMGRSCGYCHMPHTGLALRKQQAQLLFWASQSLCQARSKLLRMTAFGVFNL